MQSGIELCEGNILCRSGSFDIPNNVSTWSSNISSIVLAQPRCSEPNTSISHNGICVPLESYCAGNSDAANDEFQLIRPFMYQDESFISEMLKTIYSPGYKTTAGFEMFEIPGVFCVPQCRGGGGEEVPCFVDPVGAKAEDSTECTDTEVGASPIPLLSAAGVAGAVAVGEVIRNGAQHALSVANQFADAGMGVVHAAVGNGVVNDIAGNVHSAFIDFSPDNVHNMVAEAGNTLGDTTIDDAHRVITDAEAIIRADQMATITRHAVIEGVNVTHV